MEPFMIYTGNHLFHYTTFESALKIIVSGVLKFGDFKNNDYLCSVLIPKPRLRAVLTRVGTYI